MINCSLCGLEFNPAEHPSCGGCPLHEGCSLACCPRCGASNINPAGSRLATWLKKRLLSSRMINRGNEHAESTLHPT